MQFIFPFLNAKGFPLIVKIDPTVCKTSQTKKNSSFELGKHLSLASNFQKQGSKFCNTQNSLFLDLKIAKSFLTLT